jgi:hypothetical protein
MEGLHIALSSDIDVKEPADSNVQTGEAQKRGIQGGSSNEE